MKRIYKIGFDDFYVVRVGTVRQKPFISRFIPQNINLDRIYTSNKRIPKQSSISNGFYIIRRI
tara:strand:+ start:205 stop:393 length:189 start_codon:yes stop_codon:yes gene_type:complete